MRIPETWKQLLLAPLLVGLAACGAGDPAGPDGPDAASQTVLLSVSPPGGSAGVDVEAAITIEFSHPMDPTMSAFADLHEGELGGPEVAGRWEWMDGHTVLRFTPEAPLHPATDYVVHLGGGMMDAAGEPVKMEAHGHHMGGKWATHEMMMGGGMGGGMDPSQHMGDNWDHPSNGSHGMVFTFTTG